MASIAIAYSIQSSVEKSFTSSKVAAYVSALCWANIANAVDILCLSRVTYTKQLEWERATTKQDLKKSQVLDCSKFSWGRLLWAIELPFNLRRIGTPWQIKNIPPFYRANSQYIPSRLEFLRYRFVVLCLALLTLGLLYRGENDEFLHEMFSTEKQRALYRGKNVSAKEALSHLSLVGSYWVSLRASHQLLYSVCAILSVGLGMHEPASWPLGGASPAEAWSLRRFWGFTWHQTFRKFLTSNAEFISRSVLQIPPGTIWHRYCCLILAFAISAIIHIFMDLSRAIPLHQGGSIPFFALNTMGIMIEDLIVHVAAKVIGTKYAWWKRMVGYIWVIAWLFTTMSMYYYPIGRALIQAGERVPSLFI
ncbi:unnamed protein product [Penicillium salamii]|uniref:Wax synthase domain-containing protein n=1 Tax=Penicillium salamii TaxID=1612424 RepID=A0A9W4NCK6_9EURO|nr:unnamed protein product [Penicillium salamii]CAG7995438.1 unnamed protein product [Penicillium salamii]CAG8334370.1 unnamed protein product [Penicillium salamii]CAG8601185.1 unnamed protein product [Penicillium salamii]